MTTGREEGGTRSGGGCWLSSGTSFLRQVVGLSKAGKRLRLELLLNEVETGEVRRRTRPGGRSSLESLRPLCFE